MSNCEIDAVIMLLLTLGITLMSILRHRNLIPSLLDLLSTLEKMNHLLPSFMKGVVKVASGAA